MSRGERDNKDVMGAANDTRLEDSGGDRELLGDGGVAVFAMHAGLKRGEGAVNFGPHVGAKFSAEGRPRTKYHNVPSPPQTLI